MRIRLIVYVGAVLWMASCTRIKELRHEEIRQVLIYESKKHAAFPGVARLKSGELLAVFREGEGHVSPDGKILMCRSEDGGQSWSALDTIVSTARDCRDPSIVQLRDGLIIVNFFQSKYDAQGKIIGAVGCFTVRSFDNGRTFTSPRMVSIPDFSWSATSDAILETQDGRLLLPVYGGKEGERSAAIVVISDDGGESWEEQVVMAKDSAGSVDFQEPALIQLPDEKILCMLRTAGADGFLYQTASANGGKTWSPPKSSGIQGQAADLYATPDGTLLCAYRDFWPRGVSFVRSYDWGRTWEQEISLFSTDDDCAYPSFVTTGDEILAVHYAVLPVKGESGNERSAILGTFFKVRRPESPAGFSASTQGRNSVHLRWNAVKGASYYTVYRDEIPEFTVQSGYPFKGNGIANPTSNLYTDCRVDTGRTYYYRVTAVVGVGEPVPGTGSESEPTAALEVILR